MKKFVSAVFIVLFIISGVSALDLTGGKIKVTLYNSNGRFSLYYLDNISNNKYVPLLFDKDPKTTALFINVGNKIYTMGDSSFFKQELKNINSTSASFVWTSEIIQVTETFTLVKSLKSAFFDGVKIAVRIENQSETQQDIGVSYLLDTYMGENSKTHFLTSDGTHIQAETYYTSDLPAYFISPLKTESSFKGFQCMLKGAGITPPDRVIFANWKRLKENIFSFSVQNSRNFNFLPYSINDSASALYYNQHSLASKKDREIVLLLGAATGSLFQGTDTGAKTSEINKLYIQTVQTEKNTTDIEASLKTDLLAVDDLIKKIDDSLESPELLSKDNITMMKQIIGNLEQRKKLYENR